jgi:hypothetical protein
MTNVQMPAVYADTNLSQLWLKVLKHALATAGGEIMPLVASLTGFDSAGMPNEDKGIRASLDDFLKAQRSGASRSSPLRSFHSAICKSALATETLCTKCTATLFPISRPRMLTSTGAASTSNE